MAVMEERDEAHARMLSAEVLHGNEMEQHRKITGNLTPEIKLLKSQCRTGNKARRQMAQKLPAKLTSCTIPMLSLFFLGVSNSLANFPARRSTSLEKKLQENETIEKKALKYEISQTFPDASLVAGASRWKKW